MGGKEEGSEEKRIVKEDCRGIELKRMEDWGGGEEEESII